jgi:uncharacterized protein YuzE
MKITYDKTADAVNINLRNGAVLETLEVSQDILVDTDNNGRIVSIEILNASKNIDEKNLEQIQIGSIEIEPTKKAE